MKIEGEETHTGALSTLPRREDIFNFLFHIDTITADGIEHERERGQEYHEYVWQDGGQTEEMEDVHTEKRARTYLLIINNTCLDVFTLID